MLIIFNTVYIIWWSSIIFPNWTNKQQHCESDKQKKFYGCKNKTLIFAVCDTIHSNAYFSGYDGWIKALLTWYDRYDT